MRENLVYEMIIEFTRASAEQNFLQFRHLSALHKVRCDAQRQAVGAAQPRAGQGQPHPGLPRQARQMPAAADVGEKPDAGLRHGETGPLGRNAIARRHGQPHPAAHGHPVHDRDDRLGIVEQQRVQLVLDEEEPPRRHAVPRAALRQHADVAAGAEAALAGMVDQHGVDGGIASPADQRQDHRLAHGRVQRMQRRRPVQGQPANAVLNPDQHLIAAHERAMMTFIISVEPP
jgi:hypothetical protein